MRLPPRLTLLSLAHFSIDSYSSFVTPLLPLLMAKLELSLTQVGLLIAVSSASSSLSQPLFGFLADRLRRPWFIAFGPLVAAVFLCSVGLAPDFAALLLLLAIGGFAVSAFHPQAAVLAGSLLARRGLAMSIFVSGGTAGFSLGPLIAVGIVGTLGLERTWVWALSGVLLTVVLAAWFRRVPPAVPSDAPRAPLRELRRVARPIAALYFAAVCRSAAGYGFMIFLPIHLIARGFAFEAAGIAVSAYLIAGAVGSFTGGWLSDRLGGRTMIVASFVGAIPLFAGYLLLPPAAGVACVVAANFMLQLSLPVTVVLGQEMAPRHASTVSSMLMGAAWGVGAMMGGPAGALADAHGLDLALAGLAATLLPGLGFALALPTPARTADLAHPEPPAGPRAGEGVADVSGGASTHAGT